MARPKAKAPARQYHISGQSVVRIAGRDIYLGKLDSPESLARYAVLIQIYQSGGLTLPDEFDTASLDSRFTELMSQAAEASLASTHQSAKPILVRHVTACFLAMANDRYRDSQSELHRLTQVCNALDEHDGDTPASDYGPLAMQRQRQRWVETKTQRTGNNYSRVYCNTLTKVIVKIFKYAVSQELVDESVHRRLCAVSPLRMGQTIAPEVKDVEPVDIEVVRKTAKELTPILKTMIRVQVGTGLRPSELCRMRPCDIDRTGEVWIYKLSKHKTSHLGKTKAVPLVDDVREAITDYLNRDPEAFLFSPRESMAWIQSQKRAKRKTKVQPTEIDHRNRTRNHELSTSRPLKTNVKKLRFSRNILYRRILRETRI